MQITWRDANGNRLPGSFHPERTGRVQGERDLFGRYGKPAEMPVSAGPFIEEGHINEDDEGAYSAMAAEALGIRGQEPWWALTDWIIANWPKIQSSAPSPVKPPVQPPVQPPSPPPVAPPPAGSGLHPLSPASVRVEELRGEILHIYSDTISGWPSRLSSSLAAILAGSFDGIVINNWTRVKPFAVEALRFYRRLRAKLGDTREIPAEDR